jgi:hypothetical protein
VPIDLSDQVPLGFGESPHEIPVVSNRHERRAARQKRAERYALLFTAALAHGHVDFDLARVPPGQVPTQRGQLFEDLLAFLFLEPGAQTKRALIETVPPRVVGATHAYEH